MKTINRLVVLFSLSLFVISCQKNDVDPKTGDLGPGTGTSYNVDKAVMLQLVNNVRQSGCNCGTTLMPPVSPVAWNDLLALAADNHSKDMLANNYFNHTGLDGSTPGDRIRAVGYNWRAYGENIAFNYPNEQAVMNGWINSEGHCKNIMNGTFTEMGVAREGNYWTQEFGRR